MKVFVIIPAYNESLLIGRVVREVLSFGHTAVVINDGSVDDTREVAKQAGAIVLTHKINRGQGAALQTGIDFSILSKADIVVTFDADGQFVAKQISDIIAPLMLSKVEVVLGSRFLDNTNNVPSVRRLLLKSAVMATKFYTGLYVTDTHNGFRAFSNLAAQKINIQQSGMAHASEIIEQVKKYKLKFAEVPVTIKYTDYSLSKGQSLSNSFKIIWDLIFSRLTK